MSEYKIPLSSEDVYLLETFDNERYLRSFNKGLRGISVPVGIFHHASHNQAIYDVDPKDTSEISHMANFFQMREGRFKATVLYVEWCKVERQYLAAVEWLDDRPLPELLRVTAVLKGKRCIRALQFGVETNDESISVS